MHDGLMIEKLPEAVPAEPVTATADGGICEVFDAVITGQCRSGLLGDVHVPLCAPCAAARAARQFAG